jgi:demethylmenaquinone methyltransferase / 2-methoxy-6-polyprenyl-1,4-benzoquinol methylase
VALDALPPAGAKRTAVRAMFERIAPRYDLLNRVLSAGLDQRWRRAALDAIAVGPADVLLDLACGTGDLAELARARGARVVAVEFAREMLRRAARRASGAAFAQGDALALPLRDGAVSAVACGFALRNFADLRAACAEMARVLAPGGRLALVEVDRPRAGLARAGHSLYFDRIVPAVGALLSDRDAYAYLPQSTAYLPDEPALRALLEGAGFRALRKRPRLLGAAQIVTGLRA